MSTMRAYSRSLRLCSRTTSGVTGRSPGNDEASVVPGAAAKLVTRASAERVGRVVLRLDGFPALAGELQRLERIVQDPGQQRGPVLVRHRFDLAGVEPHAATVGTGLDLDPMIHAARQVVTVLRALHEMRLPFGFYGRAFRGVTLPPQQLGVVLDEVFVLVPAGLV